ncbi:ras association domain-containing protein 8 [Geospiza fortis]|uniref:Ras association domain-containing protein 8 n=1 Tax=Geospiza fortis TaxID=48883 RepID=A0A8N5EGK3_GEOFO|nr:ras association domain-containing protein 8 [Geospiza fortis]
MELKVWVDGIQRVVCGVSEQTTCQEVVIALARAIGVLGRVERERLPLECPLESLAKCGQYANDVQFILRRTGPSMAERPSSEGAPQAPERTFIRASLPIKPRLTSIDGPRSREPKKSMTFSLGPTGSSDLFTVSRWRHQTRDGLDLEAGGVVQPSKEELFRRVLQQQEQLHSLEAHRDTLEMDLRLWERSRLAGQENEILYLEQVVRRNETELGEEEFWQSELRLEKECERERQERVRSLRASLEEYTQRIYELSVRTEALQEEIQWEMAERAKRGKEISMPSPIELEDMATKMKRDLEAKVKQGTQLESNLASVEKALEEAEKNLQELSITSLQHRQWYWSKWSTCGVDGIGTRVNVILDEGVTRGIAQVPVLPVHSLSTVQGLALPELDVFPHPVGFSPTAGTDLPPQVSTKQLLGHPRTLPEPLVSSLNPEVVSTRQSIWR